MTLIHYRPTKPAHFSGLNHCNYECTIAQSALHLELTLRYVDD